MEMLCWLLVVVVMVTTVVATPSAVISVHKGRVAHLRARDLFPDPPREGALCKVEVMSHEPMTMRAGKFEPSVSYCFIYLSTNN